jgi:hypothetical protein
VYYRLSSELHFSRRSYAYSCTITIKRIPCQVVTLTTPASTLTPLFPSRRLTWALLVFQFAVMNGRQKCIPFDIPETRVRRIVRKAGKVQDTRRSRKSCRRVQSVIPSRARSSSKGRARVLSLCLVAIFTRLLIAAFYILSHMPSPPFPTLG